MNKLLLTIFGVLSISAYGWTEAETNLVGIALAEMVAQGTVCDGGPLPPNDPESNEPSDELFPTFGSLFETSLPCAQDWPQDAKRAAFFHYLGTLPGLVTNGEFCGDEWLARAALGFCRIKGDASVLQPALGVLSATNMPGCCQWEAAGIFEKWAQATEAMNSYLAGVLSCEGCLNLANARRKVYYAYANKLVQAYDAGQSDLARNGAAVLYRGLSVGVEAPSVDVVLLRTHPDYAASSNRLWIAELALGNEQSRDYVASYFIPITNVLHNAGQPLPAVEGL